MDNLKFGDHASAGLVARPSFDEGLLTHGVYTVQCYDADGNLKWEDEAINVVTTQGKNSIMDVYLGLSAAFANVVMGLHTTVGNASSTYATVSPQVESTAYSNGTRPAVTFSAASAGVKSTSSNVTFNINGTATITGCFIALGAAGVTTKGDTATGSAVLFSSGAFGASRSVVNGDTLNVSYSLTLT